jgi:hypothetical protein
MGERWAIHLYSNNIEESKESVEDIMQALDLSRK